MDFLVSMFGESVALISLVAMVKLTVWSIFVVLGIRFLWMLPNELRSIAYYIKRAYYYLPPLEGDFDGDEDAD